ncbi:MAG TPA: phospho-N-acetylmuramoyl-pentapeptide-transferase [Armatimonadota bacterium]|jgi:phospho-N-acetylmuramoyl-pentapeptide-transferase
MPPLNAIETLLLAVILAFFATFLTAPPVISLLRRKKLGQQIREDGPQRHLTKAGTPTMGGVIIMGGVILGTVVSWVFAPAQFRCGALLLGLTVFVAAIGSIDDWGKIRRGRSLGLRAREKLILQFLAAGLFVAGLLYLCHNGTTIGMPFVGSVNLGWAYWPVAMLFIAAMSNAVNLTDGLDGLATGTTVAATAALAILAWGAHDTLANGPAVATILACLGAACLAFLWYNRHPAKIFMGDTGSLAIGAALAGAALMLKQELALLIIGLVFIIEMGSVIIQVISFKTTGKRVFRMSPFHHHLELGGWSEPAIVTRAWLLGAVLALGGCWLFHTLH